MPVRPLPEMYDAGYKALDKKDYTKAADEFVAVETNYPTSAWAPDALIMAAYSRYLDRDFAGALLATDRFMRFHPGHADVPYVLYLRGMCYYRQVSDVRREPGMSAYALNTFEQLVERFPRSEYAKNAKNKIMILKNYLAGKVMYSARRDMARKNWTSAANRLQQIIEGAQETVMTEEALFRLTEVYTALGLEEQVHGYKEMLRKNFPDGEWAKKIK